MYIGVKHRAFGSPSVYFGPFDTFEELEAWCIANDISVHVLQLVEPTTPIPYEVWC